MEAGSNGAGSPQDRVSRSGERKATPETASAERGYYGLPVLKTPVWRWEIWSYFFLGGLAAGSFLVATLATLFGSKRDQPIARAGYLLAAAAVLACPPLLIKDLGRPARFLTMLRVVKPQSPMSLGVWGLIGFSGCSALLAGRIVLDRAPAPGGAVVRLIPLRPLAVLGGVLAGFVGGYTGVLLSVTSVPLWSRSYLLAPTFLASSVSTGLAAISLVLAARREPEESVQRTLDRFKRGALVAEALALTGFLGQTGWAARPLLDPRQHGRSFLLGAVGLGLVAPGAAGFATDRSHRSLRILASLATLVGGLCLRYALIEGGRTSAADPQATFRHADLPPTGGPA